MTTPNCTALPPPWYRQPWPLFVVALPLSAVIAGLITLWIALSHQDGIVAGDYYKQGLAINRNLARDETAVRGRVVADITIDQANPPAISVHLQTAEGFLSDREVPMLKFMHPQNPAADQTIALALNQQGEWQGRAWAPLEGVRWQISLETPRWRIAGAQTLAHGAPARLLPTASIPTE